MSRWARAASTSAPARSPHTHEQQLAISSSPTKIAHPPPCMLNDNAVLSRHCPFPPLSLACRSSCYTLKAGHSTLRRAPQGQRLHAVALAKVIRAGSLLQATLVCNPRLLAVVQQTNATALSSRCVPSSAACACWRAHLATDVGVDLHQRLCQRRLLLGAAVHIQHCLQSLRPAQNQPHAFLLLPAACLPLVTSSCCLSPCGALRTAKWRTKQLRAPQGPAPYTHIAGSCGSTATHTLSSPSPSPRTGTAPPQPPQPPQPSPSTNPSTAASFTRPQSTHDAHDAKAVVRIQHHEVVVPGIKGGLPVWDAQRRQLLDEAPARGGEGREAGNMLSHWWQWCVCQELGCCRPRGDTQRLLLLDGVFTRGKEGREAGDMLTHQWEVVNVSSARFRCGHLWTWLAAVAQSPMNARHRCSAERIFWHINQAHCLNTALR